METLERIIAEHPFFVGLDDGFTNLMVSCASNVRFKAGTYILKEGDPANTFYLIREGKVARGGSCASAQADHHFDLERRGNPGVVVAVATLSMEIPRTCCR